MLSYALIIFAIGALGGIALASFVLRGRLAPWPLSLAHAALGAIGLIILIYAAVYLASIHLRRKVAPKSIVSVHAAIAVIGFLTLLGVVFSAW